MSNVFHACKTCNESKHEREFRLQPSHYTKKDGTVMHYLKRNAECIPCANKKAVEKRRRNYEQPS